jgi:hypothetical protein
MSEVFGGAPLGVRPEVTAATKCVVGSVTSRMNRGATPRVWLCC